MGVTVLPSCCPSVCIFVTALMASLADEASCALLRRTAAAKRIVRASAAAFLQEQEALFKHEEFAAGGCGEAEELRREAEGSKLTLVNKEELSNYMKFATFDSAQLMVCGANSAGKTTFIHH